MKQETIATILAEGEGKMVEFKRELPSGEQIAKTVVAFSNTSGGRLFVGIDDKGEVAGVDSDGLFEIQDRIVSIIFDRCYPNILPEVYTVTHKEKLLLVIEVFRGNLLPYYLKNEGKNGGVYLRIGATNRKADTSMVLELERQRRHIAFDEEANYDIELDTIDIEPLRKRFESAGKVIDHQKMLNLKLLKKEHGKMYPTQGLLILLGYFSHCRVQCARFKGTTMELFLDKKEYSGTLFEQLENSIAFALNHINMRAEIKGLVRTDTYEIPPVALREAVTNALIHRDYINSGRDIKFAIYDDIVEIVSPGSFPSTITQEDIENGRSEARNRVVANVFKELGLIEQWGTGIARIKSLSLDAGLKEPVIEEQNDFVSVTFYRMKTDEKERLRTITDDYGRLSPDKQMILKYLETNISISRKSAIELLGYGKSKVHELFEEMISDGLLQRQGAGRGTYYIKAVGDRGDI
jgi:ATP-dependent DNA helicase RecG